MPTERASDATRGSGNQVVGDGNAPTRARRGRQLSPELDDRILEAALALLADVGYTQLRLDALAARAGVAKSTILRRWPSKAAVAAAAVQRLALQTPEGPQTNKPPGELQALLSNPVAALPSGQGRFVPPLIRETGHHAEI